MAAKARDALGFAEIDVIADKGYFRGPDLLACRDIGIKEMARQMRLHRKGVQAVP